jgi:hypothetical protein
MRSASLPLERAMGEEDGRALERRRWEEWNESRDRPLPLEDLPGQPEVHRLTAYA